MISVDDDVSYFLVCAHNVVCLLGAVVQFESAVGLAMWTLVSGTIPLDVSVEKTSHTLVVVILGLRGIGRLPNHTSLLGIIGIVGSLVLPKWICLVIASFWWGPLPCTWLIRHHDGRGSCYFRWSRHHLLLN